MQSSAPKRNAQSKAANRENDLLQEAHFIEPTLSQSVHAFEGNLPLFMSQADQCGISYNFWSACHRN